jgi:tetratricopeptide (TPR) repeat protein
MVLVAGSEAAWAKGCEPQPVTLSAAKLQEPQKPVLRALLTYYDTLNRKDFTTLKDLLDPNRTSDTAPGPSFGYRSFLGWKRLRIYATEVVKVEPDLNQIAVKEVVEAEAYNGAFFLYNAPVTYTFRNDGARLVIVSRGVAAVDRTQTSDPFELLYLYRDTLYRGDLSGASAYLERYLAIRPEDPYAVAMRGAALLQNGDHANALKLLEWVAGLPEPKRTLCTQLGSQDFEAQLQDSIGVCQLALKNLAAARKALERSRLLNPNYIPAYLHLAELEQASGKPDDAKAWYWKAYAILPDVPQAEVALFGNPAYGDNQAGMAYLKEDRLDEAAAMFLQASKENPAFDKPYNNLGLVREKQGQEAEAVGLFRKAMELNPKNHAVLLNLANLYLKKGDRRSADNYIDKILDMDPENLAALNLKDKASGKGGVEKSGAEKGGK